MKIDRNSRRGKQYRVFLYFVLAGSVFSLLAAWVMGIWLRLPATIQVRAGRRQDIRFDLPATARIYKEPKEEAAAVSVNLNRNITFYGEVEDTYTMDVQLFGFIPFKNTAVSVIQDRELIPAGIPIGIYVKTEGVLIIDTGAFLGSNGREVAPGKEKLQAGDYIHKVNGKILTGKKELIKTIDACKGEPLNLTVKRGEELLYIKVQPEQNAEGDYKLGVWVRDNAQGIGTLTFLDENSNFGALGHGINDMDTSKLMELSEGSLYKTEIVSVTRGEVGKPGELAGVIAYSGENVLGTITANTNRGIYGVADPEQLGDMERPVPIALKQEIEKGPAQILCTIGENTDYYDVEITALHPANDNINRGMELKVTDPELLKLTGGIVQGMSGSPILQNEKIVGAVTHVLVNDPTRGYGIFIENMLQG